MGVLINLKRYTLMKRETKEWDGNRRKIIIQVLAIREGKKKKKKKKKILSIKQSRERGNKTLNEDRRKK